MVKWEPVTVTKYRGRRAAIRWARKHDRGVVDAANFARKCIRIAEERAKSPLAFTRLHAVAEWIGENL